LVVSGCTQTSSRKRVGRPQHPDISPGPGLKTEPNQSHRKQEQERQLRKEFRIITSLYQQPFSTSQTSITYNNQDPNQEGRKVFLSIPLHSGKKEKAHICQFDRFGLSQGARRYCRKEGHHPGDIRASLTSSSQSTLRKKVSRTPAD
jgi:uncharacterized protein (DUF927 family)